MLEKILSEWVLWAECYARACISLEGGMDMSLSSAFRFQFSRLFKQWRDKINFRFLVYAQEGTSSFQNARPGFSWWLSQLSIWHCHCSSLLWHRFDPWPWKFCTPLGAAYKNKWIKKIKTEKEREGRRNVLFHFWRNKKCRLPSLSNRIRSTGQSMTINKFPSSGKLSVHFFPLCYQYTWIPYKHTHTISTVRS